MAENCVNFEAEAMKTTSSVASRAASPLTICTAAVVASPLEKKVFHVAHHEGQLVLEKGTRPSLARVPLLGLFIKTTKVTTQVVSILTLLCRNESKKGSDAQTAWSKKGGNTSRRKKGTNIFGQSN